MNDLGNNEAAQADLDAIAREHDEHEELRDQIIEAAIRWQDAGGLGGSGAAYDLHKLLRKYRGENANKQDF